MTGTENIIYQLHVAALSITPGIPLIFMIGCFIPSLQKKVEKLLPLAAVPALFAGFFIPIGTAVGVPWFFMGGRMGLDDISRIFLLSSAVVWLFAAIDLNRKMKKVQHRHILFGCFLAAMAGNFGLILAQELLGFYLFFALMSFSTYGLVVFYKSNASLRAGRIYITMVMISEVALFAALALLAQNSGSFVISDLKGVACPPIAMLALYIGLGVKIGALPLHVWMVPSYQATPTPAAAALAGAMVNAGILGWIRLLIPLEHVAPGWAILFTATGITAVFFGVVLGLAQRGPGAVLACSSISQMGIISAIIGTTLFMPQLKPQAIVVLSFFAVHHAFAKSSLFFGYGALIRKGGQLTKIHFAALLFPALSLAGLPMTSGAITKNSLKELIAAFNSPWSDAGYYLLSVSSIATTLLILHFIRVLNRTVSKGTETTSDNHLAWYGSIFMAAVTMWIWPKSQDAALSSLAISKLWHSLWPIILGCGIGFLLKMIKVPKNLISVDIRQTVIDVFNRPAWQKKRQVLRHSLYMLLESDLWVLHHAHRTWRHAKIGQKIGKIEKMFTRWIMVGLFYLVLCLTMLYLL